MSILETAAAADGRAEGDQEITQKQANGERVLSVSSAVLRRLPKDVNVLSLACRPSPPTDKREIIGDASPLPASLTNEGGMGASVAKCV